MSMKRPFLQFAIQKIESLFQKGKDNPTLLRQIKNELEHRKSKRSKTLKNKIDAKIGITDFDYFDKEKAAAEAKALEEKRIVDEKSKVKAEAEAAAERIAKEKLKSRNKENIGLYEDEIITLDPAVKSDISEKSDVSLDDAVRKSDWPITLSQLEVLMSLPGSVIISKIYQSNNYDVRSLHLEKIITPKKISKRNRIMYVLRKRKKAMKLLEIVGDYKDLFNSDITKNYISKELAQMKGALNVDKGKYNLYENISINNNELEDIRNKTEKFLLEKQIYISSKIILSFFKKAYNDEYLRILNGHFLLGILQDDDRFDCQSGFMIGLTSANFEAINTDQTTEIIKFMNHQSKPLNIEYIVHMMSSYRQVNKHHIKTLLEAKNEIFYCSAPDEYYLTSKKDEIRLPAENKIIESSVLNELRKKQKKKRLLKMTELLDKTSKE